jgi:transglutaminase-like putative cysteine protease
MSLPALLARYHHLALTMSCACLIVALQPLAPRVAPYLWPLAMLTLLAGRVGDRWVLPGWLMNTLALLVTGLTLIWIAVSWDVLRDRPMPIALIPYFGPLLLGLLVLRLYRDRNEHDLWLSQGIGLLQVALACTLTTEILFGPLLLMYVSLTLPLLALAQLNEARRRAGLADDAVVPPRLGGRIIGWTAGVVLGGMALFLLTPRPTLQSWDPFQQLGMNQSSFRAPASTFNQAIDLNKVGDVNLGAEEAFRVRIAPGEAMTSLPPEMRWRTGVLDSYREGRWTGPPRRNPYIGPTQNSLPDLGPDQVVLRFAVTPRAAGGLVLADPILFGSAPSRRPFNAPDVRERLFVELGCTLLTSFSLSESSYQYQQVTRPQMERWPLVPPPGIDPDEATRALILSLTDCPIPELAPWTCTLVDRLATQEFNGLTADTPLPPRPPIPENVPHNAELVARALTAYLATSGDYTYSLELKRSDPKLDPVLDFLTQERQGHCERFAGALALMLRTQGIPARVVRGFRGMESLAEGSYVVYQKDAHAWVEALVPGVNGKLEWIPLDGTPAGDVPAPTGFSFASLGEQLSRLQDMLWRELIVGYDANQQAALWESWFVTPGIVRTLVILGLLSAGVLVLFLLGRWLRRRWTGSNSREPLASLPLLHRLWDLLQRRGLLSFDPSLTPRELARRAAVTLAGRPETAPHADVPIQVVDLFYRLHFGGQPASPAEMRQAEAAVEALARALL